MADGGAPVVAAFDLDGTLTSGHSTLDFVTCVAGRPAVALAAVRGVLRAGFPPSRSAYKEAVIGGVLRGRPEADVRSQGRDFAAELVRTRLIHQASDELDAHRAVGHELVLVTAALDVYVDVVGELLGVDGVIATEVEFTDGVCTGRLIAGDLHDERKVQRLRSWLGEREAAAIVYAYGNSDDDEEMLRYAEATRSREASPTR